MSENKDKYKYNKWDDFVLPQLTESNYGIEWPRNTAQITKELMCFKICWEKQKGFSETLGAFYHYLNIVRLLWPTDIDIFKDVKKGGIYKDDGRIWNNYFLDIAFKLCNSKRKRKCICGPASANKTYCVANYDYVCYICAPNETLVMASTTSGSASERRIWADIKDFHRKAKWAECGIEPVGEIIEYLKAITFDPGKQLGGADFNSRDFRNGITVIPIANDIYTRSRNRIKRRIIRRDITPIEIKPSKILPFRESSPIRIRIISEIKNTVTSEIPQIFHI